MIGGGGKSQYALNFVKGTFTFEMARLASDGATCEGQEAEGE